MSASLKAISLAAMLASSAAPALACTGSGVIVRIDGVPQDVTIRRSGETDALTRPRVLDPVCVGDTVEVRAPTKLTLSLDGVGETSVAAGKPYVVSARRGAPSLAGNAYRLLAEMVVPDMKRLPWDVRLRGEINPFGPAVLTTKGLTVAAGRTSLFVRVVGADAGFSAQLADASGGAVAKGESSTGDLLMSVPALQPGAYRLILREQNSDPVQVPVNVEAPPSLSDVTDVSDPEVQAALNAVELARNQPGKWGFEAEQILASAPARGLDRERVYRLIESYGREE